MFGRSGRGRFKIVGLERLRRGSDHPARIRLGAPQVVLAGVDGSITPETLAPSDPGALEDERPAEGIDA